MKSNFKNLELRNVQIADHLSEETVAFSADIYLDGKKVGFVKNSGTGGTNQDYWLDLNIRKAFYKFVERQPRYLQDPGPDNLGPLKMDADLYFSLMLMAHCEKLEKLETPGRGKRTFADV